MLQCWYGCTPGNHSLRIFNAKDTAILCLHLSHYPEGIRENSTLSLVYITEESFVPSFSFWGSGADRRYRVSEWMTNYWKYLAFTSAKGTSRAQIKSTFNLKTALIVTLLIIYFSSLNPYGKQRGTTTPGVARLTITMWPAQSLATLLHKKAVVTADAVRTTTQYSRRAFIKPPTDE